LPKIHVHLYVRFAIKLDGRPLGAPRHEAASFVHGWIHCHGNGPGPRGTFPTEEMTMAEPLPLTPAEKTRTALRILLLHYRSAERLGRPADALAVPQEFLETAGLTIEQFNNFVGRGHLRKLRRRIAWGKQKPARSTVYCLTLAGAHHAEGLLGSAIDQEHPTPYYDAGNRTLRWRR